MSGGVDSSVVAALLVEQGYDVVGLMLRLWSPPGMDAYNHCCTPDAMARARRIAARLDIPFYALDARQPFHDSVVQYFYDGYLSGQTPNPCLACNRQIRWGFLLEHARTLGARYLATGHYARLRRRPGKPVELYRAADHLKDQSYVLAMLDQQQLAHALFPLGEYTKPEVRRLAEQYDLPAAHTKESQDLCFLAGTSYTQFLETYAPAAVDPGPILSAKGELLGQHRGLAFYTIGQRKGLGLSSPVPLYVLEKDLSRNALVVAPLEDLGSRELTTAPANWLDGGLPASAFRAMVKIRYTSAFFPAQITPLENGAFHARFDQPLPDITPGQAAVAYIEDRAVAAGLILPVPLRSHAGPAAMTLERIA